MTPRTKTPTDNLGTFPFGEPIRTVVQQDRGPKEVFVLGVRAGAVHTHWRDGAGQSVFLSLAVATEPHPFWTGTGAEDIVRRIRIPKKAGTLEPVKQHRDMSAGRALDELFLGPLGLDRSRAWLCHLVPYFFYSPGQPLVVETRFRTEAHRFGLIEPSFAPIPTILADTDRRAAILDEIRSSRATTLITLGDKPLRWFIRHFAPRWKQLADFGTSADAYGRRHRILLDDVEIDLLPLVHPRQALRLGRHQDTWTRRHAAWVDRVAGER